MTRYQKVQGNGVVLSSLANLYKKLVGNWSSGHFNRRNEQLAEIERLKRQIADKKQISGGKFEPRDLLDFAAGPIGWTMMGLRKKRDREIEKLKREAAGSSFGCKRQRSRRRRRL